MGTLFTPGEGPLFMLGDGALSMPGDSVSFTIGEQVSSMPGDGALYTPGKDVSYTISENVVMLGNGVSFMIGEGRGLTSIPVTSRPLWMAYLHLMECLDLCVSKWVED